MNDGLKLLSGRRARFRGRVAKLLYSQYLSGGLVLAYRNVDKFALLTDITDELGNRLADRVVLDYGRQFEEQGIIEGDLVEFTAKVRREAQSALPWEGAHEAYPPSCDTYDLVNPRGLRLIARRRR